MIARSRALSYRYPAADRPAVVDVDLSIDRGEFLLVAGESAGGKSTLLRAFTGLVPQFSGGTYHGSVTVDGREAATTPVREMASVAGLVFQEPEGQAIADTVDEDVAFALELRRVARPEMARRVARALDAVGAGHLGGRRIATLSGGERQRVAIAAVLAQQPVLLLLDEPTSQLDPAGADQVIGSLSELAGRGDLALVVAEHRVDRVFAAADAIVSVDAGRATRLTPAAAAATLPSAPALALLGRRLGLSPLPSDTAAACRAIARSGRSPRVTRLPLVPTAPGSSLLEARGVAVAYGSRRALSDVDLQVREGEVVALLGANGSGKTTFLRAVAGLVRHTGQILLRGRPAPASVPGRTALAGLCPQEPGTVLGRATAAHEVAATLHARRRAGSAAAVLATWGLAHLADRDPRDLSSGERQRVACAAMLAHEPPTWLMDEPTRGADAGTRAWIAAQLRAHAAAGGAAIVATHDVEAAAAFATRVVGLEDGRIAFDLPVDRALGHGGPCPTQVARVVPGALLPEDVTW